MARAKKTDTPADAPAAPRLKAAPSPSRKRVATPPSLAHDAIAQRAFELFLESGLQHGRDVEHWLQAERELSVGQGLRRVS